MGKNAADNIAYGSYNWVPTEHLQDSWRFNKLHSNELPCIIPKSSVMRSVFSICPCIQLHKYGFNVSQIWPFLLVALESIFKNALSSSPYCDIGSLPSQITQLSVSYRNVGFNIFKYLIAIGYDLIQKWTWLYSWFERPDFANHLRLLVGCNECRLKTSYCVEYF